MEDLLDSERTYMIACQKDRTFRFHARCDCCGRSHKGKDMKYICPFPESSDEYSWFCVCPMCKKMCRWITHDEAFCAVTKERRMAHIFRSGSLEEFSQHCVWKRSPVRCG